MTDFRALCEQLMELAEGKRYDARAVLARWGTLANTINQED